MASGRFQHLDPAGGGRGPQHVHAAPRHLFQRAAHIVADAPLATVEERDRSVLMSGGVHATTGTGDDVDQRYAAIRRLDANICRRGPRDRDHAARHRTARRYARLRHAHDRDARDRELAMNDYAGGAGGRKESSSSGLVKRYGTARRRQRRERRRREGRSRRTARSQRRGQDDDVLYGRRPGAARCGPRRARCATARSATSRARRCTNARAPGSAISRRKTRSSASSRSATTCA